MQGTAKDVTIPGSGACSAAYVDKSFTGTDALGTLTINSGGRLYIPDKTLNLEVAKIELAGFLQAGATSCPIGTAQATNQVTITFTGARACASGDCGGNNKGIFVNAGGQLHLFGLKGTKKQEQSWTYLSQPSPRGDTSLFLADDVATGAGAWQDGDWIVVATTSFSPFGSEFVRIQRPEANSRSGQNQADARSAPARVRPLRRPRSGKAVAGQLRDRRQMELRGRRARRGRPDQPQHQAHGEGAVE